LLISDIDRHRSGRGDSPTGSRQARAGNTTAGVAGRLLRDTANLLRGRGVTKVLSSLVFHQVPLAEKRAGLAAIHETLQPGGSLHVADYGLQRTAKMRNGRCGFWRCRGNPRVRNGQRIDFDLPRSRH